MTSSTPSPKMELLTSTVFPNDFPEDCEKRFYLCSCDRWESLAEGLQPSTRFFGLMIAANVTGDSNQTITIAANAILTKGLAYLSAWGPDCEKVHDIFDGADVEYELDNGRGMGWGPDDVVMTTWHANDSLAEAIWFFVSCAFPTNYFHSDCADWIVAVIGNKEWEKEVRAEFSKIEPESKKYRNPTK